MTHPQALSHDHLGFSAVMPRLLGPELVLGRVQSIDGGEPPELRPSSHELVIAGPEDVPTDVVAPPSVTDIGGGGRELGLEVQSFPGDDGIARETNGVAVRPGSRVTREGQRAATAIRAGASRVDVVNVVEHPQWVQSGYRAGLSLLPVHPPQIDSLVLHGMKDVIDVHRGKVWIGNVKGDGIA